MDSSARERTRPSFAITIDRTSGRTGA